MTERREHDALPDDHSTSATTPAASAEPTSSEEPTGSLDFGTVHATDAADPSDPVDPSHAGELTEPAVDTGSGAAAGQQDDGEGRSRRGGRGGFFAELPVLVLVAFVLALLLKTFLVQAFFIPSESMLPTLAVGDRVLVNKLAHEFREPERGEVVVFSQNDNGLPGADTSDNPVMRAFQTLGSGLGFVQTGEKDFIKRIIGLPGETLEMREGIVYVDGAAVPEATQEQGGYLSRPDLVDFGPVEVPEGEYFLMGDNRPNSSDSRSLLSTIDEDDVLGRAFAIVWPLNRLEVLSLPDYDEDVDEEAALGPPPAPAAAEDPRDRSRAERALPAS